MSAGIHGTAFDGGGAQQFAGIDIQCQQVAIDVDRPHSFVIGGNTAADIGTGILPEFFAGGTVIGDNTAFSYRKFTGFKSGDNFIAANDGFRVLPLKCGQYGAPRQFVNIFQRDIFFL